MGNVLNTNKLTIIFFGLGSIGSKLARLVKDNYRHDLFAFRSKRNGVNDVGIDEVYEIDDVERLSPDVAFITNPTSLHMDTALRTASMGTNLFIEKPLCDDLTKWDLLLKIVQKKQLLTYVACNLRFDPVIQYLKRNLDLGQTFYSRVICSSYLPDWREGRDYQSCYSAKKNLGGGVILDLIHEPDYCQWLFGSITKIEGKAGRCSNLLLETEDYADMIIHHASGIISNIHIDYFGRKPQRKIEIFSNEAQIEADLIKRRITVFTRETTDVHHVGSLTTDDTYLQELDYFFNCIYKQTEPMNSIMEHVTVLKPILDFKIKLGL